MRANQIEVDDKLFRKMGEEAIRAFMERQLSSLRVRYLGEKIIGRMKQAGFEHDKEVREARGENMA